MSNIQLGDGGSSPTPTHQLNQAVVKEISEKTLERFIKEYEWLGNIASSTIKAYGIFFGSKLGGAVQFCYPAMKNTELVCGETHRNKVCILSRGAVADWVPPNTSSKIISVGLRLLRRSTRFRIVLAYSDMEAGEIGTVYQASNWNYVGTTGGSLAFFMRGGWVHKRTAVKTDSSIKRLKVKYKWRKTIGKHRYVFIMGEEKKQIMDDLRYEKRAYPKREDYPDYFKDTTFVQDMKNKTITSLEEFI